MSRTKQPLGVYIHIPFCARKCAYCDFLSAPASIETMERYVECLKEEIWAAAEGLQENYQAATIFFGGGTPSILSGRLLCAGMATLIAFQAFANIAVATGIFPNTGLPLPFISYGSSSLISIFIGMGLVLNVGLQRETRHF